MFDHYLPETSIADVLSDFLQVKDPKFDLGLVHSQPYKLSSVIEHRAFTGHSDAKKYWQGVPGRQYPQHALEHVKMAIAEYETYMNHRQQQAKLYNSESSLLSDATSTLQQHSLEVHNYKFTPQGLAFIIDTLYELELTDLHVHRLYETIYGSNEFTIVLKRCVRPI